MIEWKTMKQNNKNDPSLDDVISSIKDIMTDYGPQQNPDQNNITEIATKIQTGKKEEKPQGLSSSDIMTKISGMLDEFKHQTKQYQKNISNTSIRPYDTCETKYEAHRTRKIHPPRSFFGHNSAP